MDMTGKIQTGKTSSRSRKSRRSRGFTLLELIIVVGIIGILMSALGVTISNILESAKSARTLSTLQKVEGLINERRKGMERSFTRPSFQASIKRRVDLMETGDPTLDIKPLYGISEKAVETVLKKDWGRFYFPQTFSEFMIAAKFLNQNIDTDSSGIPDILQSEEDTNGNGILDGGEDLNGNGILDGGLDISKHDPATESAEMLFVALTRLEAFGAQTAGEDSFTTDEVRDTDGDGLPELIDGWGNPLRFYRWPTSILKPFGIVGKDLQPGAAGVNDDGVGGNDDSVGEL
ncbi:MAG: prepilin-type N-terminal cleavage/methylation domain-containing protein, partial [Planctomycetaceae bacterium]